MRIAAHHLKSGFRGEDKRQYVRWVVLCTLVGLAFLVRAITFQFHPIIEGDGVHYASLARDILVKRDLRTGIMPYRASLYQFIVAPMALVVGDVELAGRLVSTIFGSLLIIPVFFWPRACFQKQWDGSQLCSSLSIKG